MTTWAMHLLTSKKVSKKININSNLFAFGNILPDIPNKFVVKDIRNFISHSKSHRSLAVDSLDRSTTIGKL